MRLSLALARELARAARLSYPSEACGVLFASCGVPHQLAEFIALSNVSPEARRYALDPRALAALEREADRRGLELAGYFHSHPDRPAVPSEEDRAHAWPGFLYLIRQATADGEGELRAWRFTAPGRRFAEEALVIA